MTTGDQKTDEKPTIVGKDPKTGRFTSEWTGRPKGAISHRKRLMNRLTANGDALMQRAIQDALAGDTALLSLFAKLLVPTGGVPAELDGSTPLEALAEGEISPKEAKDIATAIQRTRETEEMDALRTRIDELERMLGERTGK